MFSSTNFQLFLVGLFIARTTADICYTTDGQSYYCSAGQSCGNHYGDCQGLPTYAIIGIVSVSIMFLSICIRCCIYANASNNRQPIQRRFVRIRPNARTGRVQANGNVYVVRPVSTVVPVHNIVEDSPPSYEAATATEPPKY